MKTVISIIFFVLFVSIAAQAQDSKSVNSQNNSDKEQVLNKRQDNKVVRLYKTKNHNVKKELDFFTKANKAKLA